MSSGRDRAADRWARWLSHDRHGGDPAALAQALALLEPIRDRVLDGAALDESETLLDLGCGDGLIGFGALESLPRGQIIFSDISEELVERCREIAAELGVAERCSFLVSSADDLAAVEDDSVDVVTARSVLIYLDRAGSVAPSARRGGCFAPEGGCRSSSRSTASRFPSSPTACSDTTSARSARSRPR